MSNTVTETPYRTIKVFVNNDGGARIVTETNINKTHTDLLKKVRSVESSVSDVSDYLRDFLQEKRRPETVYVGGRWGTKEEVKETVYVNHDFKTYSPKEFAETEAFKTGQAKRIYAGLQEITKTQLMRLGADLVKLQVNRDYQLEMFEKLQNFIAAPKPCLFCKQPKAFDTNPYGRVCQNPECVVFNCRMRVGNDIEIMLFDESWRTIRIAPKLHPYDSNNRDAWDRIIAFEVDCNSIRTTNVDNLVKVSKVLVALAEIVPNYLNPNYLGKRARSDIDFSYDFA